MANVDQLITFGNPGPKRIPRSQLKGLLRVEHDCNIGTTKQQTVLEHGGFVGSERLPSDG